MRRQKDTDDNLVVHRTRVVQKLQTLDSTIKKELEAVEHSLRQIKDLCSSKLKEKQSLETNLKIRQEAYRTSELERQKISSEVEILKYEADTLEKRYVERISKKESLVRLLREMDDFQESVRSTIGGFMGNVGEIKNQDLQYLRMKMDFDKQQNVEQPSATKKASQKKKGKNHKEETSRERSNSDTAYRFKLTKGANMDLGAMSSQNMLDDWVHVENQMISDLMRRSAGALEIDHDLMLKKYEARYQQQIEEFKKVNEKFQREVQSEVDTIPKGRGMMYKGLDMS